MRRHLTGVRAKAFTPFFLPAGHALGGRGEVGEEELNHLDGDASFEGVAAHAQDGNVGGGVAEGGNFAVE